MKKTLEYLKNMQQILADITEKQLDAIDATVALVDAQYNVDTLDGKVQNYILNASFEITVGGNTYSINMAVECEYDYKANVKIVAPEGDFTEVTYKDIIG